MANRIWILTLQQVAAMVAGKHLSNDNLVEGLISMIKSIGHRSVASLQSPLERSVTC
jgi:hypothetical protein